MRGVFGLPMGVNFPRVFVQGLLARQGDDAPETLAQTTIYLNTHRMQRAVEQELTASGARLLPRLRLVSDLGRDLFWMDAPQAVSPLRRRLELTPLIKALMRRERTMAAESAVFDLADSLATLMDEMHGEAVKPAALASIDVAEHSAHWQRTHDFIQIIARYFTDDAAPDQQAFQRLVAERLIAQWRAVPPATPVIVAGSTGSRGTTRLLMQAVADLPQGMLVLPGFDFDMPADVWSAIEDARVGEDHPQFRYGRLLAALKVPRPEPWVAAPPANVARNRLISLSLRPAPVTDQWMVEGRLLQDIAGATAQMTLIEAPSPRAEAMSIALLLRQAADEGRSAALMTPDRNLARMVTAALDGWELFPDDSAGEPLSLSTTGRFLRMVAGLFGHRITGETLLALLKHSAVAREADRGAHLRFTQGIEMEIRNKGVAFPDADFLQQWALGQAKPEVAAWANWLASLLRGRDKVGERALTDHLADLLVLAEDLARGPAGRDASQLWGTNDGTQARVALDGLIADADAAGDVTAQQFQDTLKAVLQQAEVRKQGQSRPDIMIWGTREARIQGADLVILGGLNDGIWPATPPADPWLNRDMRLQVGLLLPERRIGLSAHDYQQAVCAPEVVLTRAKRDAQAETVASRWLNRLTNLLGGLNEVGGRQALLQMRARGDHWLRLAAAMDKPGLPVAPAGRPAPCPPVAHRPRQLSVTAIKTLIRDPYAIYAKHILGLKPLAPLRPGPDARLRGQVIHGILESFARNAVSDVEQRAHLMARADARLAEEVAWPTARALWWARLDRAADFFLEENAKHGGRPVLLEERKGLVIPNLQFTLTAQPDRIDVLPDGRLRLIDYKTGTPPTEKQQQLYDVQLLLEACMAVRGAFGADVPADVASIAYIGLGTKPEVVQTDITPDLLETMWANLQRLLGSYDAAQQGYAARRALLKEDDASDYDHLSRYGEWKMTDRAVPLPVGFAP
jgi:ATP-dependent helicase/nuclease subunit B